MRVHRNIRENKSKRAKCRWNSIERSRENVRPFADNDEWCLWNAKTENVHMLALTHLMLNVNRNSLPGLIHIVSNINVCVHAWVFFSSPMVTSLNTPDTWSFTYAANEYVFYANRTAKLVTSAFFYSSWIWTVNEALL